MKTLEVTLTFVTDDSTDNNEFLDMVMEAIKLHNLDSRVSATDVSGQLKLNAEVEQSINTQ